MHIKQIYEIVNTITQEALGAEAVVNENLSNITDLGKDILGAIGIDAYVKSLTNHIGRVIFVNRKYAGSAPSVLMDSWEFGSICEKVRSEMPTATENESWNLNDGVSYDPNIFYQPVVAAKFYNSKTTFEIPMSFTEMQVKQSFSSASQLNGFISMIHTAIENALTVKIDGLIMRTINSMTAQTLLNEYKVDNNGSIEVGGLDAKSGVRAVNLLYLYNHEFGLTGANALTKDKAKTNADFIKFACYTMGIYEKRIQTISKLFNVGGKERFTPADKLHFVMLNDFAAAANVYLQADTFHDEYTKLPNAEKVAYWQGSGQDYKFNNVSKINVSVREGGDSLQPLAEIVVDGILAVMFDRDALGVTNESRRVTTNYNPKAEFFNNWYKFDCSYFNDLDENFVVFFIA